MGWLRSEKGQAEYETYKAEGHLDNGCVLCERESLKDFDHWRLIENKFPYDKIASVHHMIIPKRHVMEPGLTEEEMAEFQKIKEDYLHKEYEFIIEATHRKKSIPAHFHVHLILAKD